MPKDRGEYEGILADFAKAGVDVDALAVQLQDEGATAFVNSWKDLLAVISAKGDGLHKAA